MSILSGAHNQIFPEVMRLLKEQGADDVMVFAGGIIPDEDIPALKALGIAEIFQPGTNTDDIVAFIRRAVTA
jgi:methylmalonyl-CoA mutase C-terminal domain/subunit